MCPLVAPSDSKLIWPGLPYGVHPRSRRRATPITDKTNDALKPNLAGIMPLAAERLLALKPTDRQFAMQMKALDFKNLSDLEALTVADRKDACCRCQRTAACPRRWPSSARWASSRCRPVTTESIMSAIDSGRHGVRLFRCEGDAGAQLHDRAR